MKMKSNAFKVFASAVVIINLAIPAVIFAQANICNRISDLSLKIGQRMDNLSAKIEEKVSQREQTIENRWQKRDGQKTENRTEWDANRAEHIAKLEERATTDAQKQAVAQFKETVNAAISARRAAIDSAIETFRKSVESAITARKTKLDDAENAYRNAVNTAYQKAQTDCASSVEPAQIRTALKANLKSAKEKFNSDREIIEKMQDSMETLIASRKQAVERAIQDFKTAMEKARTDLKAAFPKTATTTPENQ